jgi:hypothetical protein
VEFDFNQNSFNSGARSRRKTAKQDSATQGLDGQFGQQQSLNNMFGAASNSSPSLPTDGPFMVDDQDSKPVKRRRVGKQGLNEFTMPAEAPKRKRRAPTPKVSYSTAAKRKRTSKSVGSIAGSLAGSMTLKQKAFWGCMIFLFLKIIFMEKGMIDFYNMEQNIIVRDNKFQSIILENIELRAEIKKIKANRGYQKKLARDHLGVISADEYLVLFAQEK